MWEAIVEEVYASRFISIKAFAHDGGLRGLLRVCLAHQLMYYGAMAKLFYAIENCAGNAIVKRLLKILSDSTTFRKARERVRRTDTVHQHLLDISSKLMASFRSANDKPPEDASLIELARAQSAALQKLLAEVKNLSEEVVELQEKFDSMSLTRAAPPGFSPPAASPSSASSAAAAAAPASTPTPRTFLPASSGVAEKPVAGVKMSALLYDLAERRLMSSIGTQCGWSEANKVKAVLVFMKENTTVDEFKILKDFKDVKGKKTDMQVCADVEDKCMAALLALEGRNEKGKEKAFVTGVASRLADVGKGIGGPDKKKLKREV